MTTPKEPVVKKSLISWVFENNVKWQILLVFIAMLAVFARVVPLEMQKRIVNEAINLRSYHLLTIYCGIYLGAFVTASVMKYCINTLQIFIGQRAVAAMRKALYRHMLTLPLSFFRRTQPGLVVAALTTELATAGDFVGMAVAIPLTNILTLLAFAGYLFWLHPLLALVSMSIYPLVLFFVPVLQKRVNRYNRKRVDAGREVSGKVGESVSGIHEIQVNGAHDIENRKFAKLVDRLRRIRIIWNLYRYGVKATNSLFTNFSRFLIFALGGFLAIKGQLELGALVAFLSAQEKLYDPWKELLRFYQAFQTSLITYQRTMEYFDERPGHDLVPADRKPYELEGDVEVKDLSFFSEDGTQLLSDISFKLEAGKHMALVGFSGSGKSTLAHCIVQLHDYSSGKVYIGGRDLSSLSKVDVVNAIGFVSQTPFIFDGTVEENLLYGCLAREDALGDSVSDAGELPDLDQKIEALQQSGIFVDVLRFGLNTRFDPDRHEQWTRQILRLRENFRQEFGEKLAEHIESYDPERFLYHSSIAENIMFAAPKQAAYRLENLVRNERFLDFLNGTGLENQLAALGSDIAREAADLVGEMPSMADFMSAQWPVGKEDVDSFRKIAKTTQTKGVEGLAQKDRKRVLDLALRFKPGQHTFSDMPEKLENRILEARREFGKTIAEESPDDFAIFSWSNYIPSQTILANIFFGNLKDDSSRVKEKVDRCINQLLIEEEILEDILKMGMQYRVGSKGENLSGGQRQKLAIARVFLKHPAILVMDEATSGLDNASQARIQNLLETQLKGDTTLIGVVHRLDIIKNYDKIGVLKSGKLVEMGTYEELMEQKGILYDLVGEKK